jgi:hypothetical protein
MVSVTVRLFLQTNLYYSLYGPVKQGQGKESLSQKFVTGPAMDEESKGDGASPPPVVKATQ